MSSSPIYLDHHATTPVDPRVVAAMLPYFTEHFGNPASRTHAFGWRAEEAVRRSRESIAERLGVDPKEIVFTSGATEADNLAIFGIAAARMSRGRHIVTCVTEHRAVLDPVAELERQGFEITRLGVDRLGRIDPDACRLALRGDTILISLMAANNEIGTLHPIATLGAIARERGIAFHTDAAQAVGKIPFPIPAQNADLVSISAHKIYGPKGIGALYVRSGLKLVPQILGGGHERGRRSGTLDVPAIVGFARALELAEAERESEARRLAELRDRLAARLIEGYPDASWNGDREARLPGNLNLSFPGVDGEALMMAVREVAVSSGAACSSAEARPSHVLEALGLPKAQVRGSLRFGLGRSTTADDVDRAADLLVAAARRLRTERAEAER